MVELLQFDKTKLPTSQERKWDNTPNTTYPSLLNNTQALLKVLEKAQYLHKSLNNSEGNKYEIRFNY